MGPIALGVLYDLSGNFSFALTLLTLISVGLALATLRLKRLAQVR